MEIKIGDIKLTAEDGGPGHGPEKRTYIVIEFLGTFSDKVQPVPKVLASELIAAIEALEETCWRP